VRRRYLICIAVVLVGCAAPPPDAFHSVLRAAQSGAWRSHGDDRFEVWICRVPAESTAPIYGGLPLRRALRPDTVARLVGATVTPYFEAISHGQYRPSFVPGGVVTMAVGDQPQACVDRAIAGAAADTRAVLAVADAEHAPGQQGGFGDAGVTGAVAGPVRTTHRAAYVGASDFNPVWGDHPPMDLVEHEVGHTLGWVHSGTVSGNPDRYLSALDVMSDSAAARAAEPSTRDAPDTLALDRIISGWLNAADIQVARGGASTTVRLDASTGVAGVRVLVLPVDDTTFLTVERLTVSGHDAHLPRAGIAVHRVVVQRSAVASVTPLVGSAPFTDLLQVGGHLATDGWVVSVGDDGAVSAVAG
jgi:hypothetical protein